MHNIFNKFANAVLWSEIVHETNFLQGLQQLHENILMNAKVYLVCEYTNSKV